MGRLKIDIDPALLRKMYVDEKLSPLRIGNKLGCSFSTISNRLREYYIPLRSPAEARLRYKKEPFSGDLAERAYLLGFAIGDLNVYLPSVNSVTLVARCHTTQKVQVDLLRESFACYGKVTLSKGAKSMHINIYLDAVSFKFLLEKELGDVPGWVRREGRWSFIAGYSDAEGNFIINQGRARFKLDSYDKHVLFWIKELLDCSKIRCQLRLIARRGQLQRDGMKFNHDLWRLNVNEARSLEKIIDLVMPYARHKKRIKDMKKCESNIRARAQRGTI